MKGRKMPETTKEKMREYAKGRTFSVETKNKLSLAKMGDKNPAKRIDVRKKISEAGKGKHCGINNWNWKGGVSKNPNYRRIYRKNRAEGNHTTYEWELLKRQYGYTCPCCEKSEPEIKLTEDHIIPLIKGGSDFIENIQPLCKLCNNKKFTKIIRY